MSAPILYCGDPHGAFSRIIDAAQRTNASAVVLLGDLEPTRPLELELGPLLQRGVPTWFIHGNHDTDSDDVWHRVWGSKVVDRNIHRRVVELPDGTRLAGLGGVFRESVWHPRTTVAPSFRTRAAHIAATPRQDRWEGTGTHRKHWSSIYPEDVDLLSNQRTDILITHEAPGYHQHGVALIDELARSMHARVVVHGHHHDRLDSRAAWPDQGFASVGVGFRGITAISIRKNAVDVDVVRPGDLDGARSQQSGG